jgi:hypothetical protein
MDFNEIPVETVFAIDGNELTANHYFVKIHSSGKFNALNLTTMSLAIVSGKVTDLQKRIVLKDISLTKILGKI